MAVQFYQYVNNVYLFRSIPYPILSSHDVNPSKLSENSVFDIKSIQEGNDLEIPCVVFPYWLGNLSNLADDEIIHVPMYVLCRRVGSYKTFNPIIKECLYSMDATCILREIIGGSTTYYMAKGLIMYQDFTPLVMFTIKGSKSDSESFIPKELICRINPAIYFKEDLVAKSLRGNFLKNLIQCEKNHYISAPRWASGIGRRRLPGNISSVRIIIENFDRFIDVPTVPSIKDSSDTINDFLVDNVDAISGMV